jgi:hypothetical protein
MRAHEYAAPEDVVSDAADGGADAEGQRLTEPRRAAARGELAHERGLEPVDERTHGGAGE